MRKRNVIELYFNEHGDRMSISSKSLFPHSNYQSVLYANFKQADPGNVMGVYFELSNGQGVPERPMSYTGKFEYKGDIYERWQYDLGDEVTSSFRSDRDVPLDIQVREREIAQFIGIFEEEGDLPEEAEDGDHAFVWENDGKVFRYDEDAEEWQEKDELETYDMVWSSELNTITVHRAIQIKKEFVEADVTDILMKNTALLQKNKMNRDGSNATQDASINGITFDIDTDPDTGKDSDAVPIKLIKDIVVPDVEDRLYKDGSNADPEFTVNDVEIQDDGVKVSTYRFKDDGDLVNPGDTRWNSDKQCLETLTEEGNIVRHTRHLHKRIRNNTGSTLKAGHVVYITGAIGASPNVTVTKADNNTAETSERSILVIVKDIENNNDGYGATAGEVEDISRTDILEGSDFAVGQRLWLSENGKITNQEPSEPKIRVLLGVMTRLTSSKFAMVVTINTFPKLNQLSDVANNFQEGDTLVKENSKFVAFPLLQTLQNLETERGTRLLQKEVTIDPEDWLNNEAVKTVEGITEDNIVFVAPHPDSFLEYGEAIIRAVTQNENELTFKCEEVPEEAITINIAYEEVLVE